MNLNDHSEFIKTYLPKYLSPELQEKLLDFIKLEFPYSKNPEVMYSILPDRSVYYQGDGITEILFPWLNQKLQSFDVLNFDAIIVSNTCDIEVSVNNRKFVDNRVVFSAIFKVSDYIEQLKEDGRSQNEIQSFLVSLRNNEISNLFYLPAMANNNEIKIEECFVQFDLTTSHSLDYFSDASIFNKEYCPLGDRMFSLSNYGFYLFIIKLSIHYCRFREGVFRNE
jgi:hypothetical protein